MGLVAWNRRSFIHNMKWHIIISSGIINEYD